MTVRFWEELALIALLAFLAATALYVSIDYPFTARLMPQVVAVAIILLLGVEASLMYIRSAAIMKQGGSLNPPMWGEKFSRSAPYLVWILALYIGIFLVGFLPAAGVFVLAFSRLVGHTRWWAALFGTFILLAGLYIIGEAFNLRWPVGYFFDPFR